MARYVVLCDCTGPGYRRQPVGLIDDRRSEDGQIVLLGDGAREIFTSHKPNRHRKVVAYRLCCPQCTRKLRWAENTASAIIDKFAAKRHDLETVQLPAPEKTSRSLQLLRSSPPDRLHRLPPALARALAMMTDPEVVEPGVIYEYGARYVIPFGDLLYENTKLDKAR